jgi:signal transduction histidine kinase/Tfp pilus assembly protein PilF
MKQTTLFLLFIFITFHAHSQTPDSLAALLNSTKNEVQRKELYRELFKYYEYAKPDSAIYYLKMGTAEFNRSGYKDGIATMVNLDALIDADQGRRNLAREKHNKALKMYESTANKAGMARVHNSMGILDVKSGDFKKATEHFLTALKLYESIDDLEGIVTTYQKLGAVNDASDNLEKALEYYFIAIKQMEKEPVKGTQAVWIYNNIGVTYGKMGKLDKAQFYLLEALEGSTAPNYTDVRILTLNNLGILYDKMNQDKRSLAYFDEALRITKDKNLPENYARLSISRASVISKSDPQAAIQILQETLKTVKSLGLRVLEADIYDSMKETYERLKKYKEALESMTLLRILEDSLQSTEKSNELLNMQSMYELERSKTKLAIAEEKSETNKTRKNMIVVVAVILAIMLLLLTLNYRKTTILNKQLKKRKEDLSRSNKIKDRLFSVIGHDLRSPMAHIPPSLQLLEDESMTADERKYLIETLTAHSRASLETLDNLLFWGKAQMQGVRINEYDLYCNELVNNNIDLYKTSAANKQIAVINNIAPRTGIRADGSHFDFVLRNLISNAIKFTHSGGSITLAADTRSEPGMVIFSVSDTGTGMTRDQQSGLFQPFSSSTRGTADEKGSGIGLMLCKEFIEENGGRIWLQSMPGAGTTFFFSLKAMTPSTINKVTAVTA